MLEQFRQIGRWGYQRLLSMVPGIGRQIGGCLRTTSGDCGGTSDNPFDDPGAFKHISIIPQAQDCGRVLDEGRGYQQTGKTAESMRKMMKQMKGIREKGNARNAAYPVNDPAAVAVRILG